MENTEKLKSLLEPVLQQCGVRLYEINWLGSEHTLQVSIMKEDGTMDLDTCADVSSKVSDVLDQADPIVYSHGTYYAMGKELGRFGYSVRKKS